jgi:hypothetical protein
MASFKVSAFKRTSAASGLTFIALGLEAFSVVYLEIRGFKSTSFGLTYIALGLGFGAACIVLTTIGRTSA